MSDNNLDDSNDQDQNIKVYDNDEAYMFNEENSNLNNSNRDEGALQDNDLHRKYNNENEEEEIEDQDLQHPNKDAEEEEGDTIRNQKAQMNQHQHQQEEDNEEEEEDQNNQDQEDNNAEEEYNEEDNGEIPLMTLKYFSICQCCKQPFNSSMNIPYLFKCGHFFCKSCIKQHFTDEQGIKCPNDGLIANSLSELKLLHNLMNDKPVEMQSSRGNFCETHKGQKLTHYIEDTRELICVYCAFSRFKKNPKYEIKEIKDKCSEISNDVDSIIEENEHNAQLLHTTLNNIKKNQETEEKRVNNLFDQITSYIQNKKSEIISQINTIFTDNAQKLNQKFDIISTKLTNSASLKEMIDDLLKNETTTFPEILDQYNKLLRESNEQIKNSIQIQDYRFSHDEETKLYKYINNFGDLKIVGRGISFGHNNNNNEEDFGMKSYKMPTQGNIGTNASNHSTTNPNINNSHVGITSHNNNNNDMMMNNSELQNNSTYDFRIQNGRESKNKLFPTSNQTKNIMSKYSYNKPMTPGEYRSELRNYPYGLK